MLHHVVFEFERFQTQVALVWSLVRVQHHVRSESGFEGERLRTYLTFVRLAVAVHLQVQRVID
jgi:hypothetical protein